MRHREAESPKMNFLWKGVTQSFPRDCCVDAGTQRERRRCHVFEMLAPICPSEALALFIHFYSLVLHLLSLKLEFKFPLHVRPVRLAKRGREKVEGLDAQRWHHSGKTAEAGGEWRKGDRGGKRGRDLIRLWMHFRLSFLCIWVLADWIPEPWSLWSACLLKSAPTAQHVRSIPWSIQGTRPALLSHRFPGSPPVWSQRDELAQVWPQPRGERAGWLTRDSPWSPSEASKGAKLGLGRRARAPLWARVRLCAEDTPGGRAGPVSFWPHTHHHSSSFPLAKGLPICFTRVLGLPSKAILFGEKWSFREVFRPRFKRFQRPPDKSEWKREIRRRVPSKGCSHSSLFSVCTACRTATNRTWSLPAGERSLAGREPRPPGATPPLGALQPVAGVQKGVPPPCPLGYGRSLCAQWVDGVRPGTQHPQMLARGLGGGSTWPVSLPASLTPASRWALASIPPGTLMHRLEPHRPLGTTRPWGVGSGVRWIFATLLVSATGKGHLDFRENFIPFRPHHLWVFFIISFLTKHVGYFSQLKSLPNIKGVENGFSGFCCGKCQVKTLSSWNLAPELLIRWELLSFGETINTLTSTLGKKARLTGTQPQSHWVKWPLRKRALLWSGVGGGWQRGKERSRERIKGKSPGSDSKESACSKGDLGLIPGLGRSPGGGHGNPLQYSCLENSMDRGAWWATVQGITRVGQDWVTKHSTTRPD